MRPSLLPLLTAVLALSSSTLWAQAHKGAAHPSAPKPHAPPVKAPHGRASKPTAHHAPTAPQKQSLKPFTMVAHKPATTAPTNTPKAPSNTYIVQNVFKETIVVPRPNAGLHRTHRYGYGRHPGMRYGRSYARSRFWRSGVGVNPSQVLAMRRLEQLRMDIDRVRWSQGAVSPALRSQLEADLAAIVNATAKARPATSDLTRLADDLADALPRHRGPVPDASVLVADLDRIVNHSRTTPADVQGSIVDAERVLRAWRLPLLRVAAIGTDLKTIAGPASSGVAAHR